MKTKKKKVTLADIAEAAHEAGAKVTVGLTRMPRRFPTDHPHVTGLLDESERCTELAHSWRNSKLPNFVAIERLMENGHAYALAACWLRATISGSIARAQDPKPQPKTKTDNEKPN